MSNPTLEQIVSSDFPDLAALLAVVADHPDLDHHPELQGALSAIQRQFTQVWEALEVATEAS